MNTKWHTVSTKLLCISLLLTLGKTLQNTHFKNAAFENDLIVGESSNPPVVQTCCIYSHCDFVHKGSTVPCRSGPLSWGHLLYLCLLLQGTSRRRALFPVHPTANWASGPIGHAAASPAAAGSKCARSGCGKSPTTAGGPAPNWTMLIRWAH